jgi:dCMP deaminase
MNIAIAVEARSACLKHKVGCVITVDERIRATGYNGTVRGAPHCIDKCILTDEGQCAVGIHAEQNAVADAAANGVSLKGGVAYVTLKPCLACTKLLTAAGITRIVYICDTDQIDTNMFCANSKVELVEMLNACEIKIRGL